MYIIQYIKIATSTVATCNYCCKTILYMINSRFLWNFGNILGALNGLFVMAELSVYGSQLSDHIGSLKLCEIVPIILFVINSVILLVINRTPVLPVSFSAFDNGPAGWLRNNFASRTSISICFA